MSTSSAHSSDSEISVSSRVSYKSLLCGSEGPPTLVTPRDYQQTLINFAKSQNSIIYLDTGLGKTLIAIYVIKDLFQEAPSVNKLTEGWHLKSMVPPTADSPKAFFVVKTRNLIKQQSKAIDKLTGLKVSQYHCTIPLFFCGTQDETHKNKNHS